MARTGPSRHRQGHHRMSAPIYCRTTGLPASGCPCYRCNQPAARNPQ